MHAVAEAEAVRVEVVLPGAGERRIEIEHRGGLADHAVALVKFAHALARLRDDAAEFVPEHDGVIHLPTVLARVLVQVAAAHADGLDGDEHILLADVGLREFAEFDGVGFGGVIDEADHGGVEGCSAAAWVHEKHERTRKGQFHFRVLSCLSWILNFRAGRHRHKHARARR